MYLEGVIIPSLAPSTGFRMLGEGSLEISTGKISDSLVIVRIRVVSFNADRISGLRFVNGGRSFTYLIGIGSETILHFASGIGVLIVKETSGGNVECFRKACLFFILDRVGIGTQRESIFSLFDFIAHKAVVVFVVGVVACQIGNTGSKGQFFAFSRFKHASLLEVNQVL